MKTGRKNVETGRKNDLNGRKKQETTMCPKKHGNLVTILNFSTAAWLTGP